MAAHRRGRKSKSTPKKARKRARLPREEQNGLRAYSYSAEEIEKLLATGEDAERLKAYFGDERYQELRELALEAQVNERRVRGGPRVLILPGIMGSTIGTRRAIFDDVIWFDPLDIIRGNLIDLAMNGTSGKLTSLDALPLVYTGLRLRLRNAGYDADYHPYDWRMSIDDLGAGLVKRLKNEPAEEVYLVAHSMGGLVARAAITLKAPKIKRLIMLGTPNHGSFVPVQAIRAVYSVVKQVAALDTRHNAEALSSKIFTTFPGLYQMLPTPEQFSWVNLFDVANWPQTGPQPRQPLLNKVRSVQESLAKADERFFLIAGVDQETTVGLRFEENEFVYDNSIEGDGTVPLASAKLNGTQTYYVAEGHGSLPNNRIVAKAVADILANGSTAELPQEWLPNRRGLTRSVRDAELKTPPYEGRRGKELTHSEIRHVLDDVASPDARGAAVPLTPKVAVTGEVVGYAQEFNQVVVGRRRQQRIDIQLALGSITEVDSRACVLGIFRDVAPSGAALALDERLNGAIKDFTVRRMFSGNAGEIFVLPTGRHPVRADFILFIGLGHFDRLTPEVLQIAAGNVIRACIRTNVEELATVLFGAGSGPATATVLQNLVTGFFRGLKDTDQNHSFRRITICENDRERYGEIKQQLLSLTSTTLFQDVEVTLSEVTLPPPLVAAAPRGVAPGAQPAYLIIRQEVMTDGTVQYLSSVLTAGAKATVITDTKKVDQDKLDRHLRMIESQQFNLQALETFGETLANLVLAERVISVLPGMRNLHLVIVHDAPSSRIPWETVKIGAWFPAVNGGLSRRYVAENLSVAKWLEQRQKSPILNLLLVVNPTLDLAGAEREGKRIRELFDTHPSVKIDELNGAAATRPALLAKIKSGDYDVIHYAGHAFFNAANPASSGILCHGKQVLSGTDLASIGNLPSLVFFNACEAGRIRRGPDSRKKELDVEKRLDRSVGLAEAFLRGGVANYLGTYWPVGDEAAECFAEIFYTELLNKKPIGEALLAGRNKVRNDTKSVDWADYIHYGSYDFLLKQG
jgi:CHAT domain-containing protein/pimeloyl-ACP methyl ester carboxylesterase